MKFKPSLWHPIAVVVSGLNLASAGFAAASGEPVHAGIHIALAFAFGYWARVLRGRPVSDDVARMRDQVDQQAAALEDAQAALASQSSELAELQERIDFAERMLAQVREKERPPLSNREDRG